MNDLCCLNFIHYTIWSITLKDVIPIYCDLFISEVLFHPSSKNFVILWTLMASESGGYVKGENNELTRE